MNIAIIGTRGVPNYYGGFEQFAAYLSRGLVEQGHRVTVYNSSSHPYQESSWHGVDIVHCYDPEDKIGTVGQFIYDFNCILDCRRKNFDIILQLGYTSSSVWGWMLPRKRSIVTTNMDGIEWKRSKYSAKVRRFLKYAEKLGVKYSDYLIADSIGIQKYLKKEYDKNSLYIPYGAEPFHDPDMSFLAEYRLLPFKYNMLIARLEPENSIEIILDGVVASETDLPFIVVGKINTPFGQYLVKKFKRNGQIRFVDGIYDITVLNNLRYFANLYFHGHTVGGTNPSLLEAMASQSLICAHKNIFNESILGSDAFYFSDSAEVADLLREVEKKNHQQMVLANDQKVIAKYSWEKIIRQYIKHFESILGVSKVKKMRTRQKDMDDRAFENPNPVSNKKL